MTAHAISLDGGESLIPVGDAGPARRSAILALQDKLIAMPQAEMQLRHHFAPGVYCRELTVPRGVCAIGKIHKTEHISILSQGAIYVITEHGEDFFEAPAVVVAKPGAKRAVYVPVDSPGDAVWTTIHATTERDIEKLEADLTADDYEDYARFVAGVGAARIDAAPSTVCGDAATDGGF